MSQIEDTMTNQSPVVIAVTQPEPEIEKLVKAILHDFETYVGPGIKFLQKDGLGYQMAFDLYQRITASLPYFVKRVALMVAEHTIGVMQGCPILPGFEQEILSGSPVPLYELIYHYDDDDDSSPSFADQLREFTYFWIRGHLFNVVRKHATIHPIELRFWLHSANQPYVWDYTRVDSLPQAHDHVIDNIGFFVDTLAPFLMRRIWDGDVTKLLFSGLDVVGISEENEPTHPTTVCNEQALPGTPVTSELYPEETPNNFEPIVNQGKYALITSCEDLPDVSWVKPGFVFEVIDQITIFDETYLIVEGTGDGNPCLIKKEHCEVCTRVEIVDAIQRFEGEQGVKCTLMFIPSSNHSDVDA